MNMVVVAAATATAAERGHTANSKLGSAAAAALFSVVFVMMRPVAELRIINRYIDGRMDGRSKRRPTDGQACSLARVVIRSVCLFVACLLAR